MKTSTNTCKTKTTTNTNKNNNLNRTHQQTHNTMQTTKTHKYVSTLFLSHLRQPCQPTCLTRKCEVLISSRYPCSRDYQGAIAAVSLSTFAGATVPIARGWLYKSDTSQLESITIATCQEFTINIERVKHIVVWSCFWQTTISMAQSICVLKCLRAPSFQKYLALVFSPQ